jgi:hypothetical protein
VRAPCQPGRRALLGPHRLGGGGPGEGQRRTRGWRRPRDRPPLAVACGDRALLVSGRAARAAEFLHLEDSKARAKKAHVRGASCTLVSWWPSPAPGGLSPWQPTGPRALRRAFWNTPRPRAWSSATRPGYGTKTPVRCTTAGRIAGSWFTPQVPCATGSRRPGSPRSSPTSAAPPRTAPTAGPWPRSRAGSFPAPTRLVAPFTWKRLSMAAPLVYAPDGRARVLFWSRPGPYDTDSLIEFLGELHVELDGENITLIWDGLTDHRSRAMRPSSRDSATGSSSSASLLRARVEPGRASVGEPASGRTRQPLRRHHRRDGTSGEPRHRPNARRERLRLVIPPAHRAFLITPLSLYYARLISRFIGNSTKSSACLIAVEVYARCWRKAISLNRVGTVILCYHRVAQSVDDPFGLCVGFDNFSAHVDELLCVAEASILDAICKPSRKHRVVVTFDDGYADNLWNALPIARAKGVPSPYSSSTARSTTPTDCGGTGWRPSCGAARERSRSTFFLWSRARSRWRSGDPAQHQTWRRCAATCGYCQWRR